MNTFDAVGRVVVAPVAIDSDDEEAGGARVFDGLFLILRLFRDLSEIERTLLNKEESENLTVMKYKRKVW